MLDVLNEQLISLTEAAKLLPGRRQGKRPHVSCVYRWTKSGCRGVVLESVQIGGTRCTSREALSRFIANLTAANDTIAMAPVPSRQPHVARAERKLDQLGL